MVGTTDTTRLVTKCRWSISRNGSAGPDTESHPPAAGRRRSGGAEVRRLVCLFDLVAPEYGCAQADPAQVRVIIATGTATAPPPGPDRPGSLRLPLESSMPGWSSGRSRVRRTVWSRSRIRAVVFAVVGILGLAVFAPGAVAEDVRLRGRARAARRDRGGQGTLRVGVGHAGERRGGAPQGSPGAGPGPGTAAGRLAHAGDHLRAADAGRSPGDRRRRDLRFGSSCLIDVAGMRLASGNMAGRDQCTRLSAAYNLV